MVSTYSGTFGAKVQVQFVRQVEYQRFFVVSLLKHSQLHLKMGLLDFCKTLREKQLKVSSAIFNNIIEKKSNVIRPDYFWLSVCEKTGLDYDAIMRESLQIYLDNNKDKFRYVNKEDRTKGQFAQANLIRKVLEED